VAGISVGSSSSPPGVRRSHARSRSFVIVLGAVAAVVFFVAGFALGAYAVSSGTITGAGSKSPGNLLTWWKQTAAGNGTIPHTVPATVSTTAGTPTQLGRTSTGYMVNTGHRGDNAVVWNFTETTSAPTATEVKISLTVNVAGTVSAFTIYIETAATALSADTLFNFYFDAGTGTFILNSWSQVEVACSSIGVC
jgi:hypothetical protein